MTRRRARRGAAIVFLALLPFFAVLGFGNSAALAQPIAVDGDLSDWPITAMRSFSIILKIGLMRDSYESAAGMG